MAPLEIDQENLTRFCRENHIRSLALFGSALREDFRPDSDVDVLVEFVSGQEPGLFGIARMERELSPLFEGRKVDLRTSGDLGRHMRSRIVSSAKEIYAA